MDHPPGKLTPGGAGVALRSRPPLSPPSRDRVASPEPDPAAPPARADGVELLGAFERSGHREAPSLVRRADGQVVQLTPLLAAVLDAIDGRRGHQDIATVVAQRTGRLVAGSDIRFLIEDKLRPLGLLRGHDGSQPTLRKANPLLGLRLRMVITDERLTERIARPFSTLFASPVVAAVTVAFLVLAAWLLFEHGLGSAVRHALYEPGLLLLVFLLTTLSAGFHELGHAAACTYGGGKPGAMGAGLYLVWPAFYTDVTDAYRLDRSARLRVDLGGIYFNAIFALVAFGLWAATGWEALLAVIPLQILQMLRQLIPLVRLDGYHILADLTGVPDLFAHIKPILLGMLPNRWGKSEAGHLKRWVRVVVTTWVLFVVPLLLLTFALMLVVLPRVAATAWDSLGVQWHDMASAWTRGDRTTAAVEGLSILALALPLLSMSYLTLRVVRRVGQRVWRATSGRPARRAGAIAVAVLLIAALTAVWWPHGQYRPIQSDERGVVADLALDAPAPIDGLLASDSVFVAPAVDTDGAAAATQAGTGISENGAEISPAGSLAEPGSLPEAGFRFDLPAPPGEGDNQALAVNYRDGSSLIALALSLVFAGDDVIDNANQAYALASCMDCLAAAIAFQLVVVLDDADIIVPENSAVAVGAYCVRCATYALAFQIIVTLNEPLSDEATRELDLIWDRLERLEANIEEMEIEDIHATLVEIETEILELFEREGIVPDDASGLGGTELDPAVTPSPTPTASVAPTPTPTTGAEASSPTPTPTAQTSPSPESSPTPEPTPTPSPTGP